MNFSSHSQARRAECLHLAERLRAERLRRGWDSGELARRAGISRTTLYHLERAHIDYPRRSTLGKLAAALELPAEQLLGEHLGSAAGRGPDAARHGHGPGLCDRITNPIVAEVSIERPALFRDWQPADWDELYSAFGTGGPLTPDGVIQAANLIGRKRETLRRLSIVLETHLEEVAQRLIDALYQMVRPADNPEATAELAALIAAHRSGDRPQSDLLGE